MDGDSRPTPPPADLGYDVHVAYAPPRTGKLDARPAPPADDERQDADPGGDGQDKPKQKMPRWKKVLYWVIGLALLAAAIVAGVLYWLHSRQYASTDDAYVQAYITQVSPQVGGRVVKLAINDYDRVKAGQLLVQLDPRDFQVRLEQARAQRAQSAAQLDQAVANLAQQQAAVDQAQANLRVTEADAGQALLDYNRYRAVDPKAVTRQQVDTASASVQSAQARVDANRQAIVQARANVQAQKAQIEAAQAALKAADVAVANAELQLSYTDVTSPRDGQVAKRTVNMGDYVNAGQAMLAVVGEDRWVTANYKETQLAGMQVGQTVSLEVDACPDHALDGRVDSFQPGSGSVFSSLPAENATGNFVKVVQRVPVKIIIKSDDAARCRLSPGMSVVPSVKIK